LLRQNIFSLFSVEEHNLISGSEKVYLKRNQNLLRNVGNRDKIELYLLANKFAVIDPTNLTLVEQFRMINAAKIVIAESGAAITSLIFAKNKIHLIELRTNRKTDLDFWREFAVELGHSYALIEPDGLIGKYTNNFSVKKIKREMKNTTNNDLVQI
jgi:capsular polysaccharide biosynthesis protein